MLTHSQQVFDGELERAIKLSMAENEQKAYVPPSQQKRAGLSPVGLKNIGNSNFVFLKHFC